MGTRYTPETLTERMGAAPSEWIFRGQCYDSTGIIKICAITQRPIQYCFVLSKVSGMPGKIVVGLQAFPYIQRVNEPLWKDLQAGREWLMVFQRSIRNGKVSQARHERRMAAEQAWLKLTSKAKQLVRAAQRTVEVLPALFEDLHHVASRVMPPLVMETHMTQWYDGQILQLEEVLREVASLPPAPKKVIVRKPKLITAEPVVTATSPILGSQELIIHPTTSEKLPSIDDILFEDIFDGDF